MSNTPGQLSPNEISLLFEKLSPQDVAEFHAGYQQWLRQQQIAYLQMQIVRVHQQIAENNRQIQLVHPSSIALASLARLQSNGVTNLDLLDRLLDRGETWLDNTMLHLEYCEKFDFIRGNYTEWCEHALEGAYDWIDSMRKVSIEATKSSPQSTDQPPSQSPSPASANIETEETLKEATEEILLQKLMSEEDISLSDTKLEIATVLVNDIPAQPSASEATTADAPIPVDETSAMAMEVIAAPMLTPSQEASNLTPEETADSTQVPLYDTSTPLTEHIPEAPAAPAPAEIPPSYTAVISPDSSTASDTSSLSAEPASAQSEYTTAERTTIDTDNTPSSTHTAIEQTTPSEQINFEDVATIVPLPSIELHTMATSNTSDTPLLASNESNTTPIDSPPDEVAAAHPSSAAQPPKKRNFFQRLFSIFSRS
jgi:hypothetical protein